MKPRTPQVEGTLPQTNRLGVTSSCELLPNFNQWVLRASTLPFPPWSRFWYNPGGPQNPSCPVSSRTPLRGPWVLQRGAKAGCMALSCRAWGLHSKDPVVYGSLIPELRGRTASGQGQVLTWDPWGPRHPRVPTSHVSLVTFLSTFSWRERRGP